MGPVWDGFEKSLNCLSVDRNIQEEVNWAGKDCCKKNETHTMALGGYVFDPMA